MIHRCRVSGVYCQLSREPSRNGDFESSSQNNNKNKWNERLGAHMPLRLFAYDVTPSAAVIGSSVWANQIPMHLICEQKKLYSAQLRISLPVFFLFRKMSFIFGVSISKNQTGDSPGHVVTPFLFNTKSDVSIFTFFELAYTNTSSLSVRKCDNVINDSHLCVCVCVFFFYFYLTST